MSLPTHTAVMTLAALALTLGIVGDATGQERRDTTTVDRLPLNATVRFLASWERPGWRLGTVTYTMGPRCTAIAPSGGGPRFLLDSVDSLQLQVVVGSDTTWRQVDIAAIAAREEDCSAPRDTSTHAKPSKRKSND